MQFIFNLFANGSETGRAFMHCVYQWAEQSLLVLFFLLFFLHQLMHFHALIFNGCIPIPNRSCEPLIFTIEFYMDGKIEWRNANRSERNGTEWSGLKRQNGNQLKLKELILARIFSIFFSCFSFDVLRLNRTFKTSGKLSRISCLWFYGNLQLVLRKEIRSNGFVS